MEASLLEIRNLLQGQMQASSATNVDTEAQPNAEFAHVFELGSQVPTQSRDETRQSQIDATASPSPAIEKVRAAPINIVRDMKHHILGTDPRSRITTGTKSTDPVELGILSSSLRDLLLQR
jgi:hypothetical protein